jgi:hypothetical protein
VKDAYFRQPLTRKQIATGFKYLTANEKVGGELEMATYGGKVNMVPPDATATAQRDAIPDVACNGGGADPLSCAFG